MSGGTDRFMLARGQSNITESLTSVKNAPEEYENDPRYEA